jgi:hypothetical protein
MQSGTWIGLAALAAMCAGGCATAPNPDVAQARPAPVFRTGSNIAVRDPNAPTNVQSVRPDDMYRTNMPDQRPRPPIP